MSRKPHPTREREAFLKDAEQRFAELNARHAALTEKSAPVDFPRWPGLLIFGTTMLAGASVVIWMATRGHSAETVVSAEPAAPTVTEPEPAPVVEAPAPSEPPLPPPVQAPPTEIVNLGTFTQSLRGGATLRTEVQVQIPADDRSRLDRGLSYAQGAVREHIASLSADDLQTGEQKQAFANALGSRMARAVGLSMVPEVFLTQFVIEGASQKAAPSGEVVSLLVQTVNLRGEQGGRVARFGVDLEVDPAAKDAVEARAQEIDGLCAAVMSDQLGDAVQSEADRARIAGLLRDRIASAGVAGVRAVRFRTLEVR
jgi:flagellar basal body-associated protein FliL